jgi:hypothetical protein
MRAAGATIETAVGIDDAVDGSVMVICGSALSQLVYAMVPSLLQDLWGLLAGCFSGNQPRPLAPTTGGATPEQPPPCGPTIAMRICSSAFDSAAVCETEI